MNLTFSRKPRESFLRNLIEWIITFLVALLIALFIISNIITLTQVKERSMEPTFVENDRVIVYKLGLIFNEPKKGDIVILNRAIDEKGIIKNMINEGKDIYSNITSRFTGEIKKNNLIKRVIGVEGDIINIEDGNLYINNKLQEEEYIKGSTPAKSSIDYPLEVPEGKVFVLGDNREHSLDGRDFGLIDTEQVKGKVIFRVLPLSGFGRLK